MIKEIVQIVLPASDIKWSKPSLSFQKPHSNEIGIQFVIYTVTHMRQVLALQVNISLSIHVNIIRNTESLKT